MAVVTRRFNTNSALGTSVASSSGAPALTGFAGSLISVLDYCLTDTTFGIGWTKVYSDTNRAVYKQPTGTNGFYLAVDDTVGTDATVSGFEYMTNVSSGTGRFPKLSQRAALQNGWNLAFYKSISNDSVARAWQFFSNGKIFYLIGYNNTTSNTNQSASALVFGDYISYAPVDAYNTCIFASTVLTGNNSASALVYGRDTWASSDGYSPRSYTQLGSAVGLSPLNNSGRISTTSIYFGSSGEDFPSPITGGLNVLGIELAEVNVGVRGKLPGIWHPAHRYPFNPGATFNGTGDIAGKTFEVAAPGGTGYAQVFFETSDTW